MKILIALIFWMFFSVILVISIIGLLLFIPKDIYGNSDNTPSTWCEIGIRLLNRLMQK